MQSRSAATQIMGWIHQKKTTKRRKVFALRHRMLFSRRGMTLMEILIVVSLIAMTSVAIYSALSNGLRVWERSQQLVIEEDVAIFFDKFSQDLRNAFRYSMFKFEGGQQRITFPTIIHMLADKRSGLPQKEYVDQPGKVEYYYDGLEDILYRRQANYSQALNGHFFKKRALIHGVEAVKFSYFYYAEGREIYSPDVLETYPSRVEVEVEFSDKQGKKKMNRFIDIPLGS